MKEYKKPFLGAAYYPEDWDEKEADYDISKMKEAGIGCVRIAEFAWHRMEPKPGQYDFSWLHRIIDRLDHADIRVILCTPTATPPVWLGVKHPAIFVMDENGQRVKHGGRRHCCSNHPAYLSACESIVKRLGEAFGDDERIIGWQIDNEIDFQYCHCSVCLERFRAYLKDKYKSIDALNRAWNLNLFSQAYDDFGQLQFPDHGWHNPHIQLEYKLFQSKTQSEFISRQIKWLRPLAKAPIGTDAKPYNRVDYEALEQDCDIVQFNHYDKPQSLPNERFWFDFLRPMKNRPFWNTETSTCWAGATDALYSLKPYGFCRINSWMPVALGGEACMYWLWRTHYAGHELMHGAVLYSDGRPFPIFGEVQRTAREFALCSPFLCGTSVISETAVHFSSLSWNMTDVQSVISGRKYLPDLLETVYEPLQDCGIRPDVIGASKELSGYKLLFSPFMMSLEEGDLPCRIKRFVEQGGVWVAGPMTDFRNAVGAKYTASPYGMLETLTGAHRAYELPDTDGLVKCEWKDGSPFEGKNWYELFDDDGDCPVHVTEGYPTLIGKSPLVRKKVGKGTVYLLGTLPSRKDMKKIIEMAAADAGVSLFHVEGTLLVAPRRGDAGEGVIVCECKNETGSIFLTDEMTDLLTGKRYSGETKLQPYELLVLKK